MKDHDDSDADQRRDALLLQMLKTPPQPRPKRERGQGKPSAKPASGASDGKRSPAA